MANPRPVSAPNRLRALLLFTRFLDLGPWAVNLALSVGVLIYLCKLFLSPAVEIRASLVFIWARILAVDQSCQNELLRNNGYTFVSRLLASPLGQATLHLQIHENCIPEHRSMCAFILAVFCRDFKPGQIASSAGGVMEICLKILKDKAYPPDPLMRHWTALLISQLWNEFGDGKLEGTELGAPLRLVELLKDPIPEVRVAALVALTTFIGNPTDDDEMADIETVVAVHALGLSGDGSSVVRKELVIFLSKVVLRYISIICKLTERFEVKFVVAAMEYLQEERASLSNTSRSAYSPQEEEEDHQFSRWTVFGGVWRILLLLCEDPFPDVAARARAVVDRVFASLAALPKDVIDDLPFALDATVREKETAQRSPSTPRLTSVTPPARTSPIKRPPIPRTLTSPMVSDSNSAGGFYHTLRRTASVAFNLAIGLESPEQSPTTLYTVPTPSETRPAPSISLSPPKTYCSKRGQAGFKLPLKSDFFDWSTQYFQRPQMRETEAEEPGSLEYNKRLWRRTRNEKIINETQPLKEVAGISHWQHTLAVLDNYDRQPKKLLFHQFEAHLIISDDRDGVIVWDWHQSSRLNSFSNGNRVGTKITSMVFLNEDDVALLMVGSSDGVLKVYRNYESSDGIELLTAWRALSDLNPSTLSSGLVVEWQQYLPSFELTDMNSEGLGNVLSEAT
jgi:regulatory associated protein of mTOR